MERGYKEQEKVCKRFSRNKSQVNLKLKRKWRSEATKQRRKAIKAYWNKVAENLATNPRKFYSTFKSFLNRKSDMLTGNEKHFKINDLVETDQTVVAERFADYFSTMVLNDTARIILKLKENDFDTCLHSSNKICCIYNYWYQAI